MKTLYILFTCVFLFSSFQVSAQTKWLDSTFGIHGKVRATNGSAWCYANSIIALNDGKMIVGGGCTLKINSDTGKFLIGKFNSDGSIDSSFGNNGFNVISFGEISGCRSISLQNDGKIIAVGSDYQLNQFALARFNADGKIDSTFGRNGKVLTSIIARFGSVVEAVASVIQKDGKIICVGDGSGYVAMVRYNQDGTIDSTFGNNGIDTSFLGGVGMSVNLTTSGKIVVTGTFGAAPQEYFLIAQYKANGVLDSSFGKNGSVITSFGNVGEAVTSVIQPDGKIVAGGLAEVSDPEYKCAIARYNTDGSLDTLFGHHGKIVRSVGLGDVLAKKLLLQNDGKILAFNDGIRHS